MSTSDTATMVALISSYADNKGALGRRYGEWAVSAPTVEAAVAAAAMAQDELGHARATYPVLAKLGHPRAEDGLDTSDALPMLRDELPDWASMIAANLVIDGILTTWIASARDSSIEPLAQRARKILQEEGAHKVHAEAWCQRICRLGGERPRAAARSGSARRGSRPRAGPGPTTTPATARRSPRACSPAGPPRSARRCATGWRRCSTAEGCAVELRGAAMGQLTCPFCESPDVEDVAQWGGQIITRQVRCRSCNTYFEAVREDFDEPPAAG